MSHLLLLGDCLEQLSVLPDASVDAVVTDPPYGLSFMGKRWDYDVPAVEIWAECLRVLKPGGHLLAFAGTRTQHRMAVRIEDAGFDVRDMIAWVYGSGFPKSHNLSGEWQGWGTALKPAFEPITVARKPLIGTVAENVQQYGTGALNIDDCRVEAERSTGWGGGSALYEGGLSRDGGDARPVDGRWPANLIHDGSDEVLAAFPAAPGQQRAVGPENGTKPSVHCYGDMGARPYTPPRNDADKSAARFFYCAKASKKDRDEGLDEFIAVKTNDGRKVDADNAYQCGATLHANSHPTVKPTDLMAYLCRLVTPPGGVVLDPFMGSGSTGKACAREGFFFVGVERDPEYFKIAKSRIEYAYQQAKKETT